jgi:hypothetical protein
MCKGNKFLGVRLDLHFQSDILVQQRHNHYSKQHYNKGKWEQIKQTISMESIVLFTSIQ